MSIIPQCSHIYFWHHKTLSHSTCSLFGTNLTNLTSLRDRREPGRERGVAVNSSIVARAVIMIGADNIMNRREWSNGWMVSIFD